MARKFAQHLLAALTLAGFCWGLLETPREAHALSIELKDVAADRVERQRNFGDGNLPLPGTPDVGQLDQRLKDMGVRLSSPMLVRIFKTESELEVWKEKGGQMALFATYPICHWSGSLGPKLREGDKQAPEGFYTITKKQLHHSARWPRSLLINFPNILDQAEARTGTDILIHGGCTSVGCFAMTNPVSDEIHRLTTAALDAGQEYVPIHIFPFRMTEENMRTHQSAAWQGFWANLKEGFDAFEKTKHPPRVAACGGRYTFADPSSIADTGPLDACQTTVAAIKDQEDWLNGVPRAAAPAAGAVPVRTAAADISPMHLGAPESVTDAPANVQAVLSPEQDDGPAQSVAKAAAQEPRPVVCRWALRICRKTATLKELQAARRASRFAGSLPRFVQFSQSAAPAGH